MKQAVISAVLAIAVVSLLLALPREHRPDRDRQHPSGETARHDPLGAVDDEAAPGGGPPGGDVFSIAIDPHTPTTVYALAENVVYKSVDGGGSWSRLRRLLGHDLPTITIDPSNTSRLFVLVKGAIVRTSNGGDSWQSVEANSERPVASGSLVYAIDHFAVYQSRDGGETWRNLTSLGELAYDLLTAFAYDPRRPSLLYLSMSKNGILKSVDGGESWENVARDLPKGDVRAIAIDPSNPAVVYAGIDGVGVFRTRDAGGRWNPTSSGLSNRRIHSLAIDPAKPSVIYAGTDGGVFKTIDAGEHWLWSGSGVNTSTVRALAIDPSHSDVVYAGCEEGGSIFKTVDGGKTWLPARSGVTSARTMLVTQGRGVNSLYTATLEEVFAYRGGKWFTIAASPRDFEGDAISALVADVANSDVVYVGTANWQTGRHGHLYRSRNGGVTWSVVDGGLGTTPVRDIAIDPRDGGVLWARTGRGLLTSRDSGASWTEVRWNGGSLDSYRPVLDPRHSSTVYALQPLERLLKSMDGGVTWSIATKGLPTQYWDRGASISSVVIDPTAPDALYVSQSYRYDDRQPLYRSMDGGMSWVPWGPSLPRPGLWSLIIDPTNPRLLLGVSGARILRSTDGGENWSEIAGDLFAHTTVHVIRFDTTQPGTLYAGTANGVFLSADGGTTWRPTDSR
jgi:photosystem II stability/assembly factor-like uncharacterized protein